MFDKGRKKLIMKKEIFEIEVIDSLGLLKQDIDNYTKLTSKETFKLMEMYKSNETSKEDKRKIRKEIIEGNISIVDKVCKSILRKYSDCCLQYEELFSYGSECLLNCLDKFDPKKYTYFSAFASITIYRKFLSIISKTKLEYTNSFNVNNFYNYFDMEEDINCTDRNRTISEVLNTLSDVEKRVIEILYGFDDGYTHTQKEVAKEIERSESRVSQIHQSAIRKLKNPKRSNRLRDFY